MTTVYIPRTLTVGDKTLTEDQLLQEGRVFVVLAEPGAGKTELLKALAGLLQVTRVRASIFRHRLPPPGGGPLVIDAMDEVARLDSAATDQIITQASATSASATVIFAGRSSEWDQRSTQYVQQCFGTKPIIVRLAPLGDAEQRELFAEKFPGEDFETFAAAVHGFELGPLLGNPQFLELLGAAYLESGKVFTSKAQIFSDAVKRLTYEANPDLGRQKARPPTERIAARAGEVFAKLLLAGSTGIATVEQLSDCDFPYLDSLCGHDPGSKFLIDTRLVKPSDDADKHEPIHRIVAEYCAALYLVGRLEDPSDRLSRDRVFAVMAPNGVTRDELRGMLGWMAALGREPLQLAAIRLDPYAILANGDPSRLTGTSKGALLTALEELAGRDPLFRRSDVWRRFNVGHFFTPDILDQVRAILGREGHLRELMLELVVGTGASASLVPELVALVKDPGLGGARKLALDAVLSASAYDPVQDVDDLIREGSAEALELAARAVTRRGVASFGLPRVRGLLSTLYKEQCRRRGARASRYFIDRLVRSFGREEVLAFLDDLAPQITCTCAPKREFQCTCRRGASKIAGRLLDCYFELSAGPHDPTLVWSWLGNLHFSDSVADERSASVKYLAHDQDLRRSLQQLAVQGAGGAEHADDAVTRLYQSYTHAGLRVHAGDPEALSQFAFDHALVEVWTALFFGHDIYAERKGPNPGRALQRSQSRTSPAFLAAWSRRERQQRNQVRAMRSAGHLRSRRRYAARDAAIEADNRAHLRTHLADIEAGRHWGWLQHFAHVFLLEPEKLSTVADDAETPLRALRNSFPLLEPHIPSLEKLSRREGTAIAQVLCAACLVRFREGESLGAIDPRILAAAKTEAASYPGLTGDEQKNFEAALDAALFKVPGSAERFLRDYVEPQLRLTENATVSLYWLDHKSAFQHLRATLALEWLERFPEMPLAAARSLFGTAAQFGDRNELRALIGRRLTDPVHDGGENTDADKLARERQTFWQLNAFVYHAPGQEEAWEELKNDPKTILALERVLGRLASHDGGYRPSMRAEDMFRTMDGFVGVWPKVPLPDSYGTGDPENETAYRFLSDAIWKIAEDAPERRVPVLDRIIADPRFRDFYDAALSLRADAMRKIALQDFRAPAPAEVNGLLDRRGVASVKDLRALMVEELGEVQRWLNGSETDPLDTFYPGGTRVDENTARNRIVDRLQARMAALGLAVDIERHMAGGNRCDITASAMLEGVRRLLVTEVKGQWNTELFTAASAQLDQRYAIHPDAARQGVYLVLWYGNGEKVAGRSDPSIETAAALRERIILTMSEELRSRVDIVVLDLSRPSPASQPKKRVSGRRRKGLTALATPADSQTRRYAGQQLRSNPCRLMRSQP